MIHNTQHTASAVEGTADQLSIALHTHDIVAAIFGQTFDPKRVHFASFPGDPHNKDDARWHGQRLSTRGGADLNPLNNNFICMGLLDPTKLGRSIADVTHHAAFWMDDVGTKVPEARVQQFIELWGLRPTLVIETSPGNRSYTWALSQWIEEVPDDFNAQTVAAVRHALKANGWGDPAAQDSARYMRLPGINGKKAYARPDGTPFQSQVVEFNPRNTVTLSDFAAAIMGDDWIETVKSGRYAPAKVLMAGASNDRAASMDDPLVQLALAVGLNPQPSTRAGVIDCHCPNEANHTGGDPTGYAIINDGMSFCNHASCQHLRSPDFEDMMIGMYEPGVQAGIMFGSITDTGSGLVDAKSKDVVHATGKGLMASVRFSSATVQDAASLAEDAEALIVRRAKHDEEKEAAIMSLGAELVHVDEAEAFWHRSKKALMQPSRLERDRDVLALFPVGATGPKRASNVLLNFGIDHVDTVVQMPGASEIVTFNGGNGLPVRAVNTYVPSNIGRRKGVPAKFLAHIDHMFPGQPQTALYLVEALAWMIQNPTQRTSVIIMLGGEPGVGKDFLLGTFFKLVGEHNVGLAPAKALIGDFNDFLASQYVSLGEFTLVGADGDKIYSQLKELTSPTPVLRRINPKYGKTYRTLVSPRFFATTNDEDALRGVAADDRRFFVAWSKAVRLHGAKGASIPMSDDYFDDLVATYDKVEELEVLHDYLATLPTTMFQPHKAPPRSAARHDTMVSSLGPVARFVYDLVVDGALASRQIVSFGEVERQAFNAESATVRHHVTQRAVREGLQLAGCKTLGQIRVGTERPSLWTGSCVSPGLGALTEDDRKALLAAEPKELGKAYADEIALVAERFATA